MNKRIIILICIAVITIGICLFLLFVKSGHRFEIVLESSDSSSKWEYVIDGETIIEFEKEENNHYIFNALKEGSAKISFRYVNSEGDIMKVKNYDITVDKDFKIDIKEHEKDNIFEIVQTKNAGVEYKWIYSIQDEEIVKLNDITEKVESDEVIDGGIVDEVYKFEVLKDGETTINFKYVSYDEKDVSEEITYKVTIDKDMKIKITETRK